jgi:hypothetical protein
LRSARFLTVLCGLYYHLHQVMRVLFHHHFRVLRQLAYFQSHQFSIHWSTQTPGELVPLEYWSHGSTHATEVLDHLTT